MCIVSYQIVIDNANMNCYSCTTDPKLFNAHVMKHFASGRCQKLNKRTKMYVFFLTSAEPIQSFLNTIVHRTQKNGTWTEDQELAMPVIVTFCFA